ncbi:helix-turn-helix transcriptional regulator [Streptomyces lasiicapitis]|uniref:helix-turn-helix transcriptional regulator n=1 Tax=Streptomyces lasiicapitis TaxID=1923961 RepID=UPI0036B29F94
MVTEHRAHESGELCEEGSALYVRALQDGRIHAAEASSIPCLTELGLLVPSGQTPEWLRPTSPAVALPRILHSIDVLIADQRQREAQLAAAFAPLMVLSTKKSWQPQVAGVTVLGGLAHINQALDQAVSQCRDEVLTIQPGGRALSDLTAALPREQAMLSRGCRMRTLYQHTIRHSMTAVAHFEALDGDVEVRTLDEVPERLIMFDRTVAFIPASGDRSRALEIRYPAIVECLSALFDRFWRLGTPMFPYAAPQLPQNGITTRQRAIAALLTEGLTDTEIAARLAMNVRTARVHIAKLSAVLKSTSRAQLGYLIGKSGILDHTH